MAGIGGEQVAVGAAKPDPSQVLRGSGAHVPAEGELDGADGDERGGGHIGNGDVLMGMLVDKRHRAAAGEPAS